MKKIFFLIAVIPFFVFSQTKKVDEKPLNKGFTIMGNVTGYADGTSVSFLNEQTNQPEKQATITNNKFVIKGIMQEPGFKGLIFGDQPPLIPMFLDNSNVTITGDKNSLDQLSIKGSPSEMQFAEYVLALKPYENALQPDASADSNTIVNVEKVSGDFVKKYPGSYVSPLAIIRLYQADQNGNKAENLYKSLTPAVQSSSLGLYINQQIQESKINAVGSMVKDFSQNDTAGKAVKISSFRGKYVLLDFWASWCRPCRMENPNVVAAFNKYQHKNFTVLSVSLDQAKPAWINAIQMDGLTWNHVSDLKGWSNEVATLFRITSIPQNLLIDPNGKIIAKNLRGTLLDNKLSELLK